jgi:NitT/TauT family transport system ATP-binding protein/sulfonate transport system ATP-binding protein
MAQGPGLRLRIDRLALGPGAPLFSDFRLHVPQGQVLALIGPSGAGKSTLLRILSGAEHRWQGEVLVGGQAPALGRMPGYVFQDARLLPWLTAEGNLRAVAPDLTAAHIAELLAQVGLAGHEQTWPHALSGGMQRRLGLARALSVEPDLLLLDEPFVSLDRAMVRDLQSLFLKVFTKGEPTVVLVSHDPEDAARLADRAVVIMGRPARIVTDVTLPGRAGERRPEDIARIASDLAEVNAPIGAIP